MLLTVLGCSGSIPGPGAAASGYLLEADGFMLALEFGNGVLGRFQQERPLFSMDALVLSHLHPDHCIDVSSLYVARKYHPSPPASPLPIYAPLDAHSRFVAAYAPNEAERSTLDFTDVFEFHGLGSPVQIGPFTVDSAVVAHPCEAYGFRISCGGVSLAYTGDSGPVRRWTRWLPMWTCCSPRPAGRTRRTGCPICTCPGWKQGSWPPVPAPGGC